MVIFLFRKYGNVKVTHTLLFNVKVAAKKKWGSMPVLFPLFFAVREFFKVYFFKTFQSSVQRLISSGKLLELYCVRAKRIQESRRFCILHIMNFRAKKISSQVCIFASWKNENAWYSFHQFRAPVTQFRIRAPWVITSHSSFNFALYVLHLPNVSSKCK